MPSRDFPGSPMDKTPHFPCKGHGFDPWVRKIPLKKEMAIHSSTIAWKIPWTEEPGRLYSSWGCKESDTTERLHFPFLSSKNPRDPCILPMC